MTQPADDSGDSRWLALSALCDGEAGQAEARECFEGWRDDADLRRRWHSYQWIGDAMRSDDLANDPAHDQAFLLALRARLAQEPVVLAPARQPEVGEVAAPLAVAAGGRRLRWGVPAAMAAGVMMTGALVMTSMSGSGPTPAAGTPLAVASDAGPMPVSAPREVGSTEAEAPVMVRNPDLDRYLNAHRQFVGSANLALPGGVRQVAVIQDGR